MATIKVPLNQLPNNQDTVYADGSTLNELLANVEKQYPGATEKLVDPTGTLRDHITVLLNGRDIRTIENVDQVLIKESDLITIEASPFA